jgi:thiol-disulfide isomerase/thioredoxin
VIGVCGVVAAMIVTLVLIREPIPEPSTVDTSVPGISDPLHLEEPEETDERTVGNQVGDVAPLFSLPTLDGETVSLFDYRGRLVILDFWASWCVPCRLSMPTLEAMAGELGDDVILLGVSLDRSAADARAYVEAKAYTDLVTLYGSLTSARAVASTYGVLGIPRTFVIDREGVVRYAGHPSLLQRELVESLL